MLLFLNVVLNLRSVSLMIQRQLVLQWHQLALLLLLLLLLIIRKKVMVKAVIKYDVFESKSLI